MELQQIEFAKSVAIITPVLDQISAKFPESFANYQYSDSISVQGFMKKTDSIE